jgi:AcrR family transcriptional regulator
MSDDSSGKLTAKGAARRAAILRAAEALILEEGYAAFSARGVAARAGVTLSHVQYYFAAPQEMIAELLGSYVEIYASATIETFRNARGTPEIRLTKMLKALLAEGGVREKCALFMTEIAGLGVRDMAVREALEKYYAAYLDAVRTLIAELRSDLNAREAAHRAPHIVALLEGAFLVSGPLPALDRKALEPQDLARAVMRMLQG